MHEDRTCARSNLTLVFGPEPKLTTRRIGVFVRTPWSGGFPPVIVHHPRSSVMGHWCFNLAKYHLDAKRALSLCDGLHNEEALGRLYELTFAMDPVPIVVAPAHTLGSTQNALGRTFARYVAQELGFEITNEIFQSNAVKRDKIKSPFTRLSHSPTFDGTVIAEANYLLADDIFTLGGTLASLRGFIEGKGGKVVGMTVLGEKEGLDVKIALANSTLAALSAVGNGALATLIPQRTGFALDCLTEPEGRYLLEQSSVNGIRDGFDRAANG